MKKYIISLLSLTVLLVSLMSGGCSLLPESARQWTDQIQRDWKGLYVMITTGERPKTLPSPLASSVPSPSPAVAGDYQSAAANQSQQNAELLHEVFTVVYQREPRDRSEFGSFVDTLNQGASFEGVYNGFTHSSIYRQLETDSAVASPEALRTFSQELAWLEIELPEPTEFDEKSAKPLPRPVMPTAETSGTELTFGQSPAPSPKPIDQKVLADHYAKVFVGASIFTLKRVIGDELLKVINQKKPLPEKLALWYSKWAVRLSSYHLDFGLALRNKADEQFHYSWAVGSNEDRLKWECLNRLHRILNEANRQKQ